MDSIVPKSYVNTRMSNKSSAQAEGFIHPFPPFALTFALTFVRSVFTSSLIAIAINTLLIRILRLIGTLKGGAILALYRVVEIRVLTGREMTF